MPMNTYNNLWSKKGRPISLNSSEAVPLQRPPAGQEIEITVKNGAIRIAASQASNVNDLTLAFACRADVFKFIYPDCLEIKIEAITDTIYFIESKNKTESNPNDSIMEWVIQLHIVRLEANLEHRLMKFFQLLVTRLGKRTPEGLLLEHTLSHSRIPEIIGSTRSTVSRTISTLRKTRKIYIDELKKQLILPLD